MLSLSWVRRVHFPEMADLIIKGITSTSFGQQGNTCTHLPKWSKIHVPPTSSSPSHESGVRWGHHGSTAGIACTRASTATGWAPSLEIFNKSTSPLCKLCHLNTDLLPWKGHWTEVICHCVISRDNQTLLLLIDVRLEQTRVGGVILHCNCSSHWNIPPPPRNDLPES